MGYDFHSASAVPRIGICEEKNRLMDEFLRAIHELGELQAQRARAVIDDDPDVGRFAAPILEADERKDRIKNACLEHVREHRC